MRWQTKKKENSTNQFELENVGAVLALGCAPNGSVLVAHESIVVVSHGDRIGAELGFYLFFRGIEDFEDQVKKIICIDCGFVLGSGVCKSSQDLLEPERGSEESGILGVGICISGRVGYVLLWVKM